MKYIDQKQKHTEELNNFPMAFAFNNEQLQEGLEKLGVEKNEICIIPGGVFIRKTDAQSLGDLLLRHSRELDQAMLNDEFLIDAMEYELANHEYCITYNSKEAMDVLGIDLETADNRVFTCFEIARQNYLDGCKEEDDPKPGVAFLPGHGNPTYKA